MCQSKKTEDITLNYYEENADAFIAGTISADMTYAREHFLEVLPQHPYVLDFGCGSGRDTKAFLEMGCRVDAVDGSSELCKKASEFTGVTVRQMLFQELEAKKVYEGIWACSSILHLPRKELKEVLRKITDALKEQGILYTSFKYGSFEGMRNGRYFTNFTEESLGAFLEDIPELKIVTSWVTGDVRPGREEEQWLNILARRV